MGKYNHNLSFSLQYFQDKIGSDFLKSYTICLYFKKLHLKVQFSYVDLSTTTIGNTGAIEKSILDLKTS